MLDTVWVGTVRRCCVITNICANYTTVYNCVRIFFLKAIDRIQSAHALIDEKLRVISENRFHRKTVR